MPAYSTTLLPIVLGGLLVSAAAHEKRQAVTISPTAGGLIQTTPASQPGGHTIPPLVQLTGNAPTQTSETLYTTVSSGAPAPTGVTGVKSAPANPGYAFVPGTFPELDVTPPVDSDEVKGWLAQYDLSNVPDLSVTDGTCQDPAASNATERCWWTCGQCTRDTDLTVCPDPMTFGLSYDDGPSPWTPLILDYLHNTPEDIKATFFIVGSRAISYPDTLALEYERGHQLSVHTWSHPPLTTLTNAQIVAELGWTMKAIKEITGVTPNTMRPPYGDIDDRVRGVCAAMGLTPIIWTNYNGTEFDTDDWRIPGATADGESVVANFDNILSVSSKMDTGFIVLEHDLYQQTVDLAVGYILPSIINSTSPKFHLTSIIDCHHQPLGNAYIETCLNSSTPLDNSTVNAAISASASGSASVSVKSVVSSVKASASSVVSAAKASASDKTSDASRSMVSIGGLAAFGLFGALALLV